MWWLRWGAGAGARGAFTEVDWGAVGMDGRRNVLGLAPRGSLAAPVHDEQEVSDIRTDAHSGR